MYMQVKVSHVFCEGNHCVVKLANLAFIYREHYKWFNVLLSCIYLDFFFFKIGIFCLYLTNCNFYYEFGVVLHAFYLFILFF